MMYLLIERDNDFIIFGHGTSAILRLFPFSRVFSLYLEHTFL